MRTLTKLAVVAVFMLSIVCSAYSWQWKAVTVANASAYLPDTSKTVASYIGSLYSSKVKALDSITFYVESGADTNVTIVVKLLAYTATGIFADTINIATLSSGNYIAETISVSTIPPEVFQFKILATVTDVSGVRPKRIPYKVIMIYKEF